MEPFNLFWLLSISVLPLIELRGAIPVGIAMGFNPILVFFICTITNILIIPVLFFFMDYIFPFFEHLPIVHRVLDRVHRKTHKYVAKYGTIGLALFVAVPLPGSGAYSGVLAAYIFEIEKKHAFPAIAIGVVAAGLAVTLLSTGVLAALSI